MLEPEPAKRLSMDQVINHQWMKDGPLVQEKDLMNEFSMRLKEIDPQMEAARSERCRQRKGVYMGGGEKEVEPVELPMRGYKRLNVLYSDDHPVLLMQ